MLPCPMVRPGYDELERYLDAGDGAVVGRINLYWRGLIYAGRPNVNGFVVGDR
jgi:hypothetical protein